MTEPTEPTETPPDDFPDTWDEAGERPVNEPESSPLDGPTPLIPSQPPL